ncbi:unnamed protein product, partial [Adineta steineri]
MDELLAELEQQSFAWWIPNFATQQSLNNIEIFVQPKPDQRPNYPSDLIGGPPRYIQGLKKTEKEIIYEYPAIQIPDWCRTQNKLLYIRVTLTTVELQNGKRFIHPNELQKPVTEKRQDIDCKNGSIFYPIAEDTVDRNGIMV